MSEIRRLGEQEQKFRPRPYKQVRLNTVTGIKEEHYYTESEIENYQNTGKMVLDEDAVWERVEQ